MRSHLLAFAALALAVVALLTFLLASAVASTLATAFGRLGGLS